MHKYSIEKSKEVWYTFEKKLLNHGVRIDRNTEFYEFRSKLLDLPDQISFDYFEGNVNREIIRKILGTDNFINKISPLIDSNKYIHKILPHLKLLSEASIPQTAKSVSWGTQSTASNKLIELYFAGLCFQLFDNVELDDPQNSKGKNPDIMFNYQDYKWAIACKTLQGDKPEQIFQNMIKGIDQIEKSDADIGFVLINLRNLVDHDKIWYRNNDILSGTYIYENADELYNNLLEQTIKICDRILQQKELSNIKNIYQNKKTIPATVFFSKTVAYIMDSNIPTLALQPLIVVTKDGELEKNSLYILNQLNEKLRMPFIV